MARNRITRPQNMGQNRNTQMRNNARRPGTFQGGLSRNPGVLPQRPMPSPACPPGQEPGIDAMGNKTCKPAQANIAGNVPVINGQRATNPTLGKKY